MHTRFMTVLAAACFIAQGPLAADDATPAEGQTTTLPGEASARLVQADSLAAEAQRLFDAEAIDEAREAAEAALAIHQELASRGDGEARDRYLLGDIAMITGRYPEAEEHLLTTLGIQRELHGDRHPDVATTLSLMGILVLRRGDLDQAEQMIREGLEMRVDLLGPDHPDVSDSKNKLAVVLNRRGRYEEAEELQREVLERRTARLGPDATEVLDVLYELGWTLQYEGALEEAEGIFRDLLDREGRILGERHPSRAMTMAGLATLLAEQGKYPEAERLQRTVLEIQREALGEEHPYVSITMEGLMDILLSEGDLAEAERLQREVLDRKRKTLGEPHPQVAKSLANLAEVLRARGELAEAEVVSREGVAMSREVYGNTHPEVAGALNNLGGLVNAQDRFAEAETIYLEALDIYDEIGWRHRTATATLLNNLAGTYTDLGRLAEAESVYVESEALLRRLRGDDHPKLASTLSNLAVVYRKQGRSDRAFEVALEAEDVSRRHLRATMRGSPERVGLRYARRRPTGLNGLLAALTDLGGDDPARVASAWDAVMRSRALVFDEMASRHRTLIRTPTPEFEARAIALRESRERHARMLLRGPGRMELDAYELEMRDVRAQTTELERELAEVSARLRREIELEDAGFEKVMTSLPAGSALVAYVQYIHRPLVSTSDEGTSTSEPEAGLSTRVGERPREPRYAAFVMVGGHSSPTFVPIGVAAEVDAAVAAWRATASTPPSSGGGKLDQYHVSARALREIAWDPVAGRLLDADQIFIVPDGTLHLVNVASLTDDDGRFLVETTSPLVYLTAERDLLPVTTASALGGGLLALGAPDYDTSDLAADMLGPDAPMHRDATTFRGQPPDCAELAALHFSPLPATEEELDLIVEAWRAGSSSLVTQLMGEGATETALKWLAPQHRVLHIATHGFFVSEQCAPVVRGTRGVGVSPREEKPRRTLPQNPLLLSGLALAGSNARGVTGPGEDDGILTSEEIASLNLLGVEWAVLSACDTGVGEIKVGEGVLGLRRAFELAGVRTLIMSLWAVEDEASRDWMGALYTARFREGLSAAESVRSASLAVLAERRRREQSVHPFYWAGFVAAGR